MSGRREIEFPWGDSMVLCRPTLARMSEVETKIGAAPSVLKQIGSSEFAISKLCQLVAIIIRGGDGVPKDAGQIMDSVFEGGADKYYMPVIHWLHAGITVDEPAAAKSAEDKPGN